MVWVQAVLASMPVLGFPPEKVHEAGRWFFTETLVDRKHVAAKISVVNEE